MKKPGFFKRLSFLANQSSLDKYIQEFFTGSDNAKFYGVEGNSMAFSAVFACFRVLAETFASVPVFEYRKLPNGDREQTDDTGLYQMLHGITNDEMSSYNWKESSMYQLCAGGNSISRRILDNMDGATVGLYPFEWQNIKIERDKNTGNLIYKIKEGATTTTYTRDQIFHVPGPSVNGITGMSVLEFAAQAINLGLSYERFGNNFYKNGATPSGMFEFPGHLKEGTDKTFIENLKKEYSGLKNAGTPMFLEDGLKYSPITMKLIDAEFLSSKKFQIEDICRFCRVPLHLVQNLDRATNNNIEHQSLEFVMYTMLPHFKRYEECINTQLVDRFWREKGYYFEFEMNTLVRGDMKSRYEAYGIARQWGFACANDILRLENRPRIPNGDIYLQPSNMIEAGKPVPVNGKVVPEIQKEIEDLLSVKR
jgi:HK97 family phage portal protein